MAKHTVQDILQRHLKGIFERNNFTLYQYRALEQLSICRTAKLGGHAQYCAEGHLNGIWYNSCKHRACPQCRGLAGEEWRQNVQSMLLDCPHHHVIFTLPEEFNVLWRYNRALFTRILFSAVKDTLQLFSKDPKYLNATPGLLLALHTWGRNLILHPHLHVLISHGGLNADGQWIEPKKQSLFPQKPVMMVYRGKVLALVRKALIDGELILPPSIEIYQAKGLLNKLGRKDWVVHFCQRYDHARGVAKYLSRYVKSGPFKNSQICHADGQRVSFRFKSHTTGRVEKLSLSIDDFVKRLMEHVPLPGKPSVRYCGLYTSSLRTKLNQARKHLGQPERLLRKTLPWQEYLDEMGHAPTCEVCGLPLYHVDIAKRIDVAA